MRPHPFNTIHSISKSSSTIAEQTRFTHTKNIYFAIPKWLSIALYCAVPASLPSPAPMKQLHPHAHSVAAVWTICRRDFKRSPWYSEVIPPLVLFLFFSEIFARILFSLNFAFVKIKSSRNGEITLLITDIDKWCHCRKFLMLRVCLVMLFAKIKFSRKFPDLQYKSQACSFTSLGCAVVSRQSFLYLVLLQQLLNL